MNKIKSNSLAIFFLWLCGCVSHPKTTIDYDREFNFKSLKTYAWINPGESHSIKTLDNKRQINAINIMLRKKGYTSIDSKENASFLLRLHHISDSKLEVERFYRTWGYYPYFHPRHYYPYHCIRPCDSITSIREYQLMTLVLDVVSLQKKQVVWRGSISYRLPLYESRTSSERDFEEKLKIEYLLQDFPPS